MASEDLPTDPPGTAGLILAWSVAVAISYDAGWSENRMWRNDSTGPGRHLTPWARVRRSELVEVLRPELAAVSIVHHRLWLWLHVSKPDHRGDALNAIKLVSDAVQEAAGLDDRWFGLGHLGWDVRPGRGVLRLWCGQEAGAVDSNVCGRCGDVLPLHAFNRNKGARLGRAATCRECAAARRHDLAAERRELYDQDQPPPVEPGAAPPPW